jgi:hypothetical protein
MPSLNVSRALAPGGPYPAKIVEAVERESKAGNPMIELRVKVGGAGCSVEIRDYLVFTANNLGALTQFAAAIGLRVPTHEGESLCIEADDCLGQRALVEIGNSDRVSPKTGNPYLEITKWLPLPAADTQLHPY